jgi:hypothetical protein
MSGRCPGADEVTSGFGLNEVELRVLNALRIWSSDYGGTGIHLPQPDASHSWVGLV